MNLELKNKVVLIAGASQGIGYATALAFAREGARVAICARDKDKIEKAAKKIHDETHAEISATAVDLTQAEAIQHWGSCAGRDPWQLRFSRPYSLSSSASVAVLPISGAPTGCWTSYSRRAALQVRRQSTICAGKG